MASGASEATSTSSNSMWVRRVRRFESNQRYASTKDPTLNGTVDRVDLGRIGGGKLREVPGVFLMIPKTFQRLFAFCSCKSNLL